MTPTPANPHGRPASPPSSGSGARPTAPTPRAQVAAEREAPKALPCLSGTESNGGSPTSSDASGLEERLDQSAQSLTTGPGIKRVLVVDDDERVCAALADVLASEGYIVDKAHNGVEAVRRAVEHAPDLVLLDLHMPHWDGWKALGRLDDVRPLLPVIVITARPNQYEAAVRLGVDAFMEKPLNIPVLLRALKRLVEERSQDRIKRITDPAFVTCWLESGDANARHSPAQRPAREIPTKGGGSA